VSDHTQSRTLAPYGSWESPFSIDEVIEGTVPLREPGSDGATIYWLEGRPSEGGRSTLIRYEQGERTELTPNPFDVRSRVHEYGGGAWTARDGIVIVSSGSDGRLYRIGDSGPVAITPEGAYRYADMLIDTDHDRIIAVREDHTLEGVEPINTLVQLDLDGPNEDGGQVIISGSDFVSSPALAPNGKSLSWLQWNHPNMPWDGTQLYYADVARDGALHNVRLVTGGRDDSIVRPRWNNTGLPVFVSDRSGWWNLYADRGDKGIVPLRTMDAEFAEPQWVFGMSSWDFMANGSVICSWTQDGIWRLGRLDVEDGPLHVYDLPFTEIDNVSVQQATNSVIFLGGSPTDPGGVVRVDIETGEWEMLRRASQREFDPEAISVAQPISWTSDDGTTAHGFYYAPVNPRFAAPEGERPPLLVKSHGGPTSATSSTLNLEIQFWTSRGFAVLDVNYGGSTGYGRTYRERLNGTWGIVDVADCRTGAEMLADKGLADPARLAIKGGSAGGYTTLAALTTTPTFSAGVSRFGIGDLEAMTLDTHKFESRYLDGLVGPYPEAKSVYIERSPIHHLDRLESAMLLLQGLEDKVVPPNQATMMAEAVRSKGLPVAHIEFPNEGHGFRRAENIRASLAAELSFYGQIFGFTPADDIPEIVVENI
jgi:dipeptidyl aminopeptidase/acylaminoacyl peptidase